MLPFKQSTKVKVIAVTPMAMKMGAKDTLPALSIRCEAVVSNNELDQLCPGLREFMFAKGLNAQSATAAQQGIEGVEAVSDLPSLSLAGQRMGTFEWNDEQTGCTLTVDRGLGDKKSNPKLEGCTVKKLQLTGQEGGSVRARFTVNTSASEELDDVTHGRIAKLKKREIWITLEGPKVDTTQQTIDADRLPEGASVNPLTPLGALTDAVIGEGGESASDAAWPFPTSKASDVKVTTKPSRSARPN